MSTIIRVASATDAHAVAGAIAGKIRADGQAEVQAIGPNAVNQAIKGATVARGFLDAEAIDLTLTPAFVDVDVDGQTRTAMRLTVVGRRRRSDQTDI